MIAKHSSEESKNGEGVEVVENCPIDGNIKGNRSMLIILELHIKWRILSQTSTEGSGKK